MTLDVGFNRSEMSLGEKSRQVTWVLVLLICIAVGTGIAMLYSAANGNYEPWAWRLAPAVAGMLLAAIFLLLARRVAPNGRAALLATILLLLDGVFLVQSRVAMTNVFAVLSALEIILSGQGYEVAYGASLAAAQKSISAFSS